MRLRSGCISISLSALIMCMGAGADVTPPAAAWSQYGHDAQHSGQSSIATAGLGRISWSAAVDLQPQYSGGALFIHYGSPVITASNTVIFPVKTGPSSGFRFEARNGATGALKWAQDTDYVLPPHSWVPSVCSGIDSVARLYYPGKAGGIIYCNTPNLDGATASGRFIYYGKANYDANPSAYDNTVFMNTPITIDSSNNVYFGVHVTGPNPLNLKSGLVRIGSDGSSRFMLASDIGGDTRIKKIVHNCGIAISNDQRTLYVAVTTANGTGGGSGSLVNIRISDMKVLARRLLKDPYTGNDALLLEDGTACPMVGLEGDVYFGIEENPFYSHRLRGYLLHFNSTLSTIKTPGAFGWDNTPSVVPAKLVGGYTGTSKYLLLTKYNNYVEGGGDGVNKVAILDPNNLTQADPVHGGIQVMKEVKVLVGPTPDPGHVNPSTPNAVREWCINTAAVDIIKGLAIVNCEDGHCYAWNLKTGAIAYDLLLAPPTGEAYTPTVIGPDGTAYAINNAILFAMRPKP